ncbi:MAG TPA: 4Fe-4S binding protein [Thermoguttaceae bacterium]|nr:4Fe-4S binding protein [Thermoguttaceae bacterium]
MTRPIYILPALLLLSVFAEAARAELRQPIPEFVEHVPPTSQHPQPLPDWREYLDVAALLVALSLASLFALKTRSRRGLFLLAVASLVWFGFWRKGCVCAIGSIQNVALAIGDPTYQIPLAAVVFFALPLVFTLFFGRTFCAAVCPLGAVQEVVAVRPVKVPAWLEHTLGLLAYVYLGAAVVFAATGTAFVICRYDLFVGFFRLGAGVNMLILGGCFLVIGLFVGRPYCRFLCPYGAILGLLSKVSKRRVEIPPEECVRCKLCEEVCPYGAIREPTVDQPAGRRRRGRWRLAGLIVLLPLLAASGGWLGSRLDLPFARMHPTFRLAERVRLENEMKKELNSRMQELPGKEGMSIGEMTKIKDKIKEELLDKYGLVTESTDASDAFDQTGRPAKDLYTEAIALRSSFATAGMWFGAWVGLVIGLKLIHLSVRRRRSDYQPERSRCVACGRCFWYCPGEQARRGWVRPSVRHLSQGDPTR